ncbi:unnamed protein product, partial [Polarella glacialis]
NNNSSNCQLVLDLKAAVYLNTGQAEDLLEEAYSSKPSSSPENERGEAWLRPAGSLEIQLPGQAATSNSAAQRMPTPRSNGSDTCRAKIHDLLDNPESSVAAQAIHYFLMLVIITSTVGVIIETMPEFQSNPVFMPAEMCITALFTTEFALRLYACDSLQAFASNGFNIIDFLAIFPGYVELLIMLLRPGRGNPESAMAGIDKAANSMRTLRMIRIVRLVRVFRVLRVAKFARHSKLLSVIFIVFIKVSQSGLAVVLMLMCFAM